MVTSGVMARLYCSVLTANRYVASRKSQLYWCIEDTTMDARKRKLRREPVSKRVFGCVAALLMVAAALPLKGQHLAVAAGSTVNFFGPSIFNSAPVAAAPGQFDAAINPAGTLAAVSNNLTGFASFYNLTVNPPVPFGPPVTPAGGDLVFSLDGGCLLAGLNGSVFAFDAVARALRSSIPGVTASGVAVTAPNFVLVGDNVTHRVRVLAITPWPACALADTGSSLVVSGASGDPYFVAVTPNGLRVLVANAFAGTVLVLGFTGPALAPMNTIPLSSPLAITVLPNGTKAYVYHAGGVRVLDIDGSNNVTDTGIDIPAGGGATGQGARQIVTDGTSVFLTTATGVGVIDVATNKIIASLPTADFALGMDVKGVLTKVCPPHTIHGHLAGVPDGHNLNSHQHHGEHGHIGVLDCPPHAPGHSPGLTPQEGELFNPTIP